MFSHFFNLAVCIASDLFILVEMDCAVDVRSKLKLSLIVGNVVHPLQHYAMGCGHCLKNEPAWDRIVIIGHYLEPLSSLIHRFKFQKQFWLDRSLSRLLYLAVREARRTHGLSLPQAIIPVPLYHFRQWYRGYNQADLLANWLSSWCHVPNCNHVVKRIKHTHTQRGLTAKDRRQNLKNAFAVNTKNLFLMNALLWWMM